MRNIPARWTAALVGVALVVPSSGHSFIWADPHHDGFACSGSQDCGKAASLVALAGLVMAFGFSPKLIRPHGAEGAIEECDSSFEAGLSPSGTGTVLFRHGYYGWFDNRLGVETASGLYYSDDPNFMNVTAQASALYRVIQVPRAFDLSAMAGGEMLFVRKASASRPGFPFGLKMEYSPRARVYLRGYAQYIPMVSYDNAALLQSSIGYRVDAKQGTDLYFSHRYLRNPLGLSDHILMLGITFGFPAGAR